LASPRSRTRTAGPAACRQRCHDYVARLASGPLARARYFTALVCCGSGTFEGVYGLHDLHLDRRGLLGERLSIGRDAHHESIVIRHRQLGTDLLDDARRLGGVHHIGIATDADQGDVSLHLLDVRVRITVTREPVASPVDAENVPDPVVAR